MPRLLCQLPTQCITYPVSISIIMPALSISYNLFVYITMSSEFKDCNHALNFVFTLSLFPILPITSRHFSCPPKRCFSHSLKLSIGFEYFLSFAHFWSSLFMEDGIAVVYAFFVFKRKRWRVSNLCNWRTVSSQK